MKLGNTQVTRRSRARRIRKDIRRAAKRIDPYTARMVWSYEDQLDPYGIFDDPPYSVGRSYFLEDPEGEWIVLVHEVRDLHPEISDEEWSQLMKAASKRDTSWDALPNFHAWG